MKHGAAWFDLSTNAPSLVKKLSAAFAEKGAHMLDAPVSGGPQGAASRKLAIWVGGDKAAFDRHKPVLDAIGDQARYIGPIGTATVAKLVHNMSGYAIVCALAETFAMGVKAGVEPLALWEAVRQGAAGRRYTFDALINQWLPGKYDPADFSLKLAHKDVGLATALGRELGLPMRICDLAYAEMTEAMNRGWAGRDSRVVMVLGAGARRHRGQGRSRAPEGGAGAAVPGDAGGEEVGVFPLRDFSFRVASFLPRTVHFSSQRFLNHRGQCSTFGRCLGPRERHPFAGQTNGHLFLHQERVYRKD